MTSFSLCVGSQRLLTFCVFRLPGEQVKGAAETAGNVLQDDVDVDGGNALEAAPDNKRVDFEVCMCVNAGARVRGCMHIRKRCSSKRRESSKISNQRIVSAALPRGS
jgi:hypothetical protein